MAQKPVTDSQAPAPAPTETGLTLVQPDQFKALSRPVEKLKKVLLESLGREKFTANDFKTIKVPSGFAPTWTIEDKSVDTVEGVIIHQKPVRTMWLVDFDKKKGSNTPPDCFSNGATHGSQSRAWIYQSAKNMGIPDLVLHHGNGNAPQDCDSCPFQRFKTAKGGEGLGQKCQLKRRLYLLVKDKTLPVVVITPTKSLKPAREYFFNLMDDLLSPTELVTQLRLKKATNAGGIDYSQIVFSKGPLLDELTVNAVESYRAGLMPFLEEADQQAAATGGDQEVIDGSAYQPGPGAGAGPSEQVFSDSVQDEDEDF